MQEFKATACRDKLVAEKLKILDVRCCPILSLPPGLSKLTNLQELSGFNMSSGCHLHELRCLKQLVVLKIQLTSTSKIQDDELTVLSELNGLKLLSIDTKKCKWEEIFVKLDDLSPPPNLEELYIKYYGGKTTPKWINPASLPKLKYLCIEKGLISRIFSGFDLASDILWELEGLSLRYLHRLKSDWKEVLWLMPRIRYFELSYCRMPKGLNHKQVAVCDKLSDELLEYRG